MDADLDECHGGVGELPARPRATRRMAHLFIPGTEAVETSAKEGKCRRRAPGQRLAPASGSEAVGCGRFGIGLGVPRGTRGQTKIDHAVPAQRDPGSRASALC
eukprot:scaffold20973_cov53-Phaeocystis_antarctica.AAC.1